MFIIIGLILLIAEIAFKKLLEFKKRVIRIFQKEKVHRDHALLYNRKDVRKEEEKYIEKKVDLVMITLIAGCILAEISLTSSRINPVLIDENTIMRPAYDENKKVVELYTSSKEGPKREKVQITVSERIYKREDIENLAGKAREIIYRDFKGDNASVDMVRNDLNLMTEVEDFPFKIQWKTDKPLLLKRNGTIDKKELKKKLKELNEESIVVKLYATMSYESYSEEIETAVRIYPPLENEKAVFNEKLTEAISLADEDSRESDRLILPSHIDGMEVEYAEKSFTPLILLMLAIVMAAGIVVGADNDLSKKVLERNNQMESDYPRIVNRYALYYCAGMHPKTIWKEICREYRLKISKGEQRRYAFEEMLKCEAKMNDGLGEIAAMNEFASECRQKKYRTFVNLIEQTLVKGKEEMADALRKEAEEATNEKLIRAKIKGEEAGTRLLLPMFMMLAIVLIIVVVPAFINFKM